MKSCILSAVVLISLCFFTACSKNDAQIAELTKKIDEQASIIKTLQFQSSRSVALYALFDDADPKRHIGSIISGIPFHVGDRIFDGDDMWDVKFVKIFVAPDGTDEVVRLLKIDEVQLLVTFAGKASHSAEQAADPRPLMWGGVPMDIKR